MTEKECTEQIKYHTELLRLTWITLLAVGGSTASLVLGDLSGLKIVFALAGVASTIGLTVAGWQLDRTIRRLMALLGENRT